MKHSSCILTSMKTAERIGLWLRFLSQSMGAVYILWSDWRRLSDITPKQFSLGYRFPSWSTLPSGLIVFASVGFGLRIRTKSPLDPDIGGSGVLIGLCVPVLLISFSLV